MPDLRCILVTPERTVRDSPAEFVTVTLFDGEIGIARGHTPLVGRLGCGEMRITAGGRIERYYVEGGFVEVLGDVVSVLSPRVIAAEAIDAAVVREQLATAQERPARTPELLDARQRTLCQCHGQLRVARRREAAGT
ncbi:MAG: F0F1 ATP synthase subunit epsilon [Thermoguttaceae bacterium]|jgi:F-type H+-transporting ATPase subunit epsilon